MSVHVLDTIALLVYLLCVGTSLTCAILLWRGYRASHTRLLLWSACCFMGFCLNAVLVIVDVRVLPETDLSVWRSLPSLIGLACLIYGMIWDVER